MANLFKVMEREMLHSEHAAQCFLEAKRRDNARRKLMTDEQRDILRHALGLGRGSREYRNHFVTGPGSTDYLHCEALVAAGMMAKRSGNPLSGGDDIYSVTDAGRAALKTPNVEVSGG